MQDLFYYAMLLGRAVNKEEKNKETEKRKVV